MGNNNRNETIEGLVTCNNGNRYQVLLDDGRTVTAAAKGNLRLRGVRTTSPVAVGDRVTVTDADASVAFISAISPRRNYIIRRASNLSKESHILASNVDCVLLVATLTQPVTSTTFIDRFLATAEAYGVPAILVINKSDLLCEAEDQELLEAVCHLYRTVGYQVIVTSVKAGSGLDELREAVKGKIVLLSGNSGVGKSSLINALVPDAELRTAVISDAHRTGMHTTTFSRMYDLPDGGRLIDTPGVKGFGTIDFDRHEVAHFFPEIFAASARCRFGDCTHTGEPGCAVMADIEAQLIAPSRYASYLSVLSDTDPASAGKYR